MDISQDTVSEAVESGFDESELCEDYALVASDLWEAGIDVELEEDVTDEDEEGEEELIDDMRSFLGSLKSKDESDCEVRHREEDGSRYACVR